MASVATGAADPEGDAEVSGASCRDSGELSGKEPAMSEIQEQTMDEIAAHVARYGLSRGTVARVVEIGLGVGVPAAAVERVVRKALEQHRRLTVANAWT